MGDVVLLLLGALVVGAIVFGVAVLITGEDPGMTPAVPDGRVVPLPTTRPLIEGDVASVKFDTAVRGYRMSQVDAALRRAAYDLGYKSELIQVLEAEILALREGRQDDADSLRRARESAVGAQPAEADTPEGDELDDSPLDLTVTADGAASDAAPDAEAGKANKPDKADKSDKVDVIDTGAGTGHVAEDTPETRVALADDSDSDRSEPVVSAEDTAAVRTSEKSAT